MAQDRGYDIVQGATADDDLIDAAIAEFKPELDKAKKTSLTQGWVRLTSGIKCSELFSHGLNVRLYFRY